MIELKGVAVENDDDELLLGDEAELRPRTPWLDRWRVLGLSLVAYSGLGFGDTFGLYSQATKEGFNLTQSELDAVAMAGFWPNLAGAAMIPGLVNDRYGGPATLFGAAFFIFVGLLGYWATLTGKLSLWHYGAVWQLAVFESIRSFGNQWLVILSHPGP